MPLKPSDLSIRTLKTKDEVARFVFDEVADRMGAWRPRGIVLHNTGSPTLAQFNRGPHGSISDEQRILNSIPYWASRGFLGCPHAFILPGRVTTANPMWKKGTHSPTWNATFWGFEMAGDFDTEAFPPETEDFAVHLSACLYTMLGHEPDDATFKFHKEDPATTHKHCPGKNAGTKETWIKKIRERMSFLDPGDATHEHAPDPAVAKVEHVKATVDVPANDFLNVRDAAGARARLVDRLRSGAAVTILGDPHAAWVRVQTPGASGWVASRFLKIS